MKSMKPDSVKNKTLYLEVNRDNDRLKIDIRKPGDSVWTMNERFVSMETVERRSLQLTDTLNKNGINRGKKDALGELKNAGQMMCDELFPPGIKENLRNAADEFLIITIDDSLVHIPWELLCLEQEFLCQRFSIGRLVKTRWEIPGSGSRNLCKPLKIWILANPGGDLPSAGSEGLMIFRRLLHQGNSVVKPVLESEVCSDKIRERIKHYDIIHFAGHAEYNSESPGKSSWKLKDSHFTAKDISRMAGGSHMPALIFSNACQSAQTGTWDQNTNTEDNSFGLVNAFMCSGVKHYIGTSWKIPDQSGSLFACKFYEHLLSGLPVGKAVRLARNILTEEGDAACWTSYLLYGDPASVYFDREKQSGYQETADTEPDHYKPQIKRASVEVDNGFRPGPAGRAKKQNLYKLWTACFLVIAILAIGFKIMTEVPRTSGITLSVAVKEPPEGKENFIAHMIESRIKEKLPGITLLERTSLDLLLKEYELIESRLVPRKNKIKVEFLATDLYLIIEVDESDTRPFVLMRLADQRTSKIIQVFDEPLEPGKLIKDQKERLTENLIKTLNHRLDGLH